MQKFSFYFFPFNTYLFIWHLQLQCLSIYQFIKLSITMFNYSGSNTSWKTMFGVSSNMPSLFFLIANFNLSGFPTLEHATYSCPWVNTWDLSQSPAYFSVWPGNVLCYFTYELHYLINLTLRLVDCSREACLNRELPPLPFKGVLIGLWYEDYSWDEHLSVAAWDNTL